MRGTGVPTVVARVMCSKTLTVMSGREYQAGQMFDLPYAQALLLKLCGAVTIADEDAKHAEALAQLEIYGGDCWFAPHQQTTPKVLEALENPQGSA